MPINFKEQYEMDVFRKSISFLDHCWCEFLAGGEGGVMEGVDTTRDTSLVSNIFQDHI